MVMLMGVRVQELEVLGLGESGEDVNVGMWGEEGRERYAMTKPTSQDNIRQFIEVSSRLLWRVLCDSRCHVTAGEYHVTHRPTLLESCSQ